jgi:hypothetical protein
VGEEPTHDVFVRVVHPGKLVDQVCDAGIELLEAIGAKETEMGTAHHGQERSCWKNPRENTTTHG